MKRKRVTQNPRGQIMSRRVEKLYYVHAADGVPYVHRFGAGVVLCAEPDGSIRLYHPHKRLWRNFA